MRAENQTKRRWFATALTLSVLLLAGTRPASAQENLPLADDDLTYAGKLVARGFEDLAVELYERLAARPGLTPNEKQDLGRRMVDALRALAARTPDLADRSAYLSRADRKINELVKEFGQRVLTPEFRYQQALVLQTEGRSLAKALKDTGDADRKKTLADQGAQKLDDCAKLLDQIASEMKAKIDAERTKDPIGYQEKVRDVEIALIKAELQRAWTAYYKADLYEVEDEQRQTNLSEGIRLFGKFVDDYPNVMAMLNARYGRGLCYKLLEKWTEALDDFGGIVKMIDEAGAIPEVQPLKARCTIEWAEISAREGKYDDAIAGLDKMLTENPALQDDPKLAELGLLTKGEVLGGKGLKLKKDGDADGASKVLLQAIAVLREVVRMGGVYSYKASELMAVYAKASGMENLDPESRIALAEALLREGKYDDSIVEVRKVLDDVGADVSRESSFKARRLLAFALRSTRAYEDAVKEYQAVLRLYTDQPREELAKVHLQYSLTLGMYAKASPSRDDLDKAYVSSLMEMGEKYPETSEGANARYYYGEALKQRAGSPAKWEEAARVYAEVTPRSKYYGRARYLEGLCYYNVCKVYSTKRDEKNPKAQQALKTAQEKLVDVIQNLPPPKAGEDWHVEAARTLADIHLDLGNPQEALNVLDMVAKKYPGLTVGNPKVLAIRLQIYITMGKLEEAVAIVDELAQKKAESDVLLRGYMTLGDAYQKEGDRLKKAGKLAEGDKAHKTAAGLLKMALQYVKEDPVRMLNWLAARLFVLKDYESCIQSIDTVEKAYQDEARKADSLLWRLRVLKAKCYESMGYWPDEGLKLLEQLEKQYPEVASIKILRASVHETKKEWAEALLLWDQVEEGVKPRTPDWFDAKYHRALCHYMLGDVKRGNEIIDSLEALHPEMGGPEMKAKFKALREKYGK